MAIFLKLFFFIDTDITNKFKSPGLTLTRKKFWFILNEQNKKIKRSGKNNSRNRRRAIVRKIAILLFVSFHPSVCAYQADADNILNHMSEVSAYAYILLECINFLFFFSNLERASKPSHWQKWPKGFLCSFHWKTCRQSLPCRFFLRKHLR